MDTSASTEPAGNDRRRRRRRGARVAADEAFAAAQQPILNWQATTAWWCVSWGLIPIGGLVLGTAGVILGAWGLGRVRRRPEDLGIRHAVGALVLGPIEIATNLAGIACILQGISELST